jgi:hypothetical protein
MNDSLQSRQRRVLSWNSIWPLPAPNGSGPLHRRLKLGKVVHFKLAGAKVWWILGKGDPVVNTFEDDVIEGDSAPDLPPFLQRLWD